MRLLALLLTLAMVAAACSGDGDTATGDTATGDDAAADDSGGDDDGGDDGGDDDPEPEPAEEEAVDLGNVEVDEEAASCANEEVFVPGEFNPGPGLTMANSLLLSSGLNPHNDQAPAGFSHYTFPFESLVRQDPVDGSVVPWVARCWEASDAGDQLTFFLNEGITFHDGAPLDAAAVVANVEFIQTAGPPEVLPPVAGQLAMVESVEAIDDLTVQFNLSGPGETLLLSGLIRNSGFLVSPNALGSAGANPIGSGPYVVDSVNADNSEIEFVANENYWRPQDVGLETVRFLGGVADQARLDGLNAGQFDAAVISNNQVDLVPAATQNTTVRIGFVVADWTGETIPALANRDVRCAAAAALNRVGIQEAGGNPAESAVKQFAASPTDYAFIDDLDSPDFDLELAQSLIDGSGEDASSIVFSNRHLPATFWPVVSSAFSGALAEIGITMNNEVLDPPAGSEMFANLARGDSPIQIIAFNEPNALQSLIARTGGGGLNPSGVSPDGVTELVNEARGLSFEEGEAAVAEAWQIMIEECVFIMNNILTTSIGHQTSVTGLNHARALPVTFWPQGVRNDG